MTDIVIAWVDGEDPCWLAEKNKYIPEHAQDAEDARYRDWGLLKYLFRSIECFAPWVRTVHLVTWGHVPEWLNLEHPKLHVAKHTDFIPEKYLPTFNSHTIELNLHRIPGLSEQFIYFNDDMFLTAPVRESYFFKNGLPCDEFILDPVYFGYGSAGAYNGNNLEIINTFFSLKNIRKKHEIPLWKIFFPLYGVKNLARNAMLMQWPWFPGFHYNHLPTSFSIDTFDEVWFSAYSILDQTCMDKFRSRTNVSQWLFKYWQLACGYFYPRNPAHGKVFHLKQDINTDMLHAITSQKYRMICVNDTHKTKNFQEQKTAVQETFHCLLPERCSFEKQEEDYV